MARVDAAPVAAGRHAGHDPLPARDQTHRRTGYGNQSRPLSFVFDTGDKVGVIDLDRAKELRLTLAEEVKVGGAGPEQLAGYRVHDATFSVVGLSAVSQPVLLAIPLGRLARRFGHDFDGIFGADLISHFVVEIDYAAVDLGSAGVGSARLEWFHECLA